MNNFFKQHWPHFLAVFVFIVISFTYLSPLLEGKQLSQPDIVKFQGMSKEIEDYRETTGEEPLWTNSMFGGMPAFQISVHYTKNIAVHTARFVRSLLPRPADMVFLYMIGFYILLLVLGASPWLSMIGAVAFAFSSYNFIIIEAGHNTKAYAIAYMAPVLAGFILTLRGRLLSGAVLTALALALQLQSNHLQITYYFLFILFFWGIAESIKMFQENRLFDLSKSAVALLAAVVIAVGVNFGGIWSTYAYAEHTMRGPSELSFNEESQTSGLDKDYATAWSYGVGETFSLLIPNVKGGATGAIGHNQSALDNVDRRFRQDIANQNHYWGDQPFTSGPVYAGAVVMFLFMLSMFFWNNKLKWYLLVVSILTIMLAWGKNFMPLTDFFLDYFPGYNKFRAVSMILVVPSLLIPLVAFMGMREIIKNPEILVRYKKKFYFAFGLTGGLCIVFYLMPSAFFSFFSQMELQSLNAQKSESPAVAAQIDMFMANLEAARIHIFRADAIRSFAFILAAAIFVFLYAHKKIKINILYIALGILIITDMWPVCKRYLNDSNFLSKRFVAQPFQPNAANQQIMQDTDPHFRVFNPDANPFNETATSYFHKSIGGYHGAKLQRYQDIIDFHLGGKGPLNMDVINMLNTKYFIRNIDGSGPMALLNPDALGNAWFVEDVMFVENADEEIMALNDFKPDSVAIVDNRFKKYLKGYERGIDTTAIINLTHYQPNRMKYEASTAREQLAVFSEIYYPDGWEVTVNGEPAEHFRVNYILRAMIVPEGKSEIVFEFRPRSYFVGERISLLFSTILIVLLVATIYLRYIKKKQQL